MLEEMVEDVEDMLRVMDGPLTDATRLEMGLQRIVTYLRAAERQQSRVDDWLYDPAKQSMGPKAFPLDQGAALSEAHFLFVCWDSIYKVAKNLRRNAYGLVTPRTVLKRHRGALERYRDARDRLEHLPERFPGGSRTDWKGDADHLTGTIAGIQRDGFFVFQGEKWDVSKTNTAQLRAIVSELVEGCLAEVTARHEAFLRGESAMWVPLAR